MIVLACADLHFSENQRDEYRFQFFPFLRKAIRKHNIELVLILGDLTENKNRHPDTLVNRIVDELHKTAALCPIVLLMGNHDIAASPDTPFFGFLGQGRVEGLTFIKTPTEGKNLPIPPLHRLGRTILLPFTPDFKRDWAQFNFSSYNWVFCHQSFEGATGAYGGIPPSTFPKRVPVIAGDIHIPQTFGSITYVGSPYTVDFGDQYQGRVLLLDRQRQKSLPYYGPQKKLVELNTVTDVSDTNLNQGDILKIRIPPDPKRSWQEIKELLYDWYEKHGYVVWSIQPIGTEINAHKVTAQKVHQSDDDLIRTFGRRRGLSEQIVKSGLWLKDQSMGD